MSIREFCSCAKICWLLGHASRTSRDSSPKWKCRPTTTFCSSPFLSCSICEDGTLILIVMQIIWSFSIWLESVAILPQLFMLQRTGEAETITTHYLFALGVYRALYIPNWLYRYFTAGHIDKTAWFAGIIQTVLYSDFFYIYYTK